MMCLILYQTNCVGEWFYRVSLMSETLFKTDLIVDVNDFHCLA